MAVVYKTSNTKDELLGIAKANGITVDDTMTKDQIIASIDTYNAQASADTTESAAIANDTVEANAATQSVTAEENDGYDRFVYVGPTIPHGRLRENAVFRGKIKDVLNYLSDVLEDYLQVKKLIVPTNKLAAYSAKVKTAGNVAHKYYNDIVSTMHGNKEG